MQTTSAILVLSYMLQTLISSYSVFITWPGIHLQPQNYGLKRMASTFQYMICYTNCVKNLGKQELSLLVLFLLFMYSLDVTVLVISIDRGKRKAAKVALQLAGNLNNLEEYGLLETSLDVSGALIDDARKAFLTLYGCPHIETLNESRQHVFAGSKSDLRVLPPTEDAFYHHILQCLYQLILYKRAHLSNRRMLAMADYGRKIVNGKLQPIMMTRAAKATFAVISDLRRGCYMVLSMFIFFSFFFFFLFSFFFRHDFVWPISLEPLLAETPN